MAVDAGLPPLNSTARVNIQIEDVNDNTPEWETFITPVNVWENATLNTYVTQVIYIDKCALLGACLESRLHQPCPSVCWFVFTSIRQAIHKLIFW